MKTLISLIFIFIVSNACFGQFLTSSAEGKGSIPLPLQGVGLAVDIGKSEVALGLNNYDKVFKSSSNSFKDNYFVGINVTAKNADGLANLFRSGDIVPAGDLLGFAGYSFTNKTKTIKLIEQSERLRLNRDLQKELSSALDFYVSLLLGAVIANDSLIEDANLRNTVVVELTDTIMSAEGDIVIQNRLSNYRNQEEALKVFNAKLKNANKILYAILGKKYTSINNDFKPRIEAARVNVLGTWTPWRITPFILGGIQARSFTRFLQLSTPDFNNSFQEELFRGGIFGMGLNVQVSNFWFGLTYSYLSRDNFINLTNKEYTLKTTDTSGNQSLIREKKITGYSGKYSKVETNELSMDILGDFFLNDSSRLLANLYLRGSVKSRDTAYLKNYTNIGAGLYFIGNKGKFIGGFYVELPDVNNVLEKSKPIEERNVRAPFKKLSFGIVTKFNISSVFGFTNRGS